MRQKKPGKQTTPLCKQLETKIVIKKLQSVLNSFMARLAFTAIRTEATSRSGSSRTPSSSSAIDESSETMQTGARLESCSDVIVIGEQNLATKSSDGMIVPVESSPMRYRPLANASEPMLVQ